VDADVLDWLKSQGKGYQSCINAILRREMLASLKKSSAPYRLARLSFVRWADGVAVWQTCRIDCAPS